jgi:hypothetical protein
VNSSRFAGFFDFFICCFNGFVKQSLRDKEQTVHYISPLYPGRSLGENLVAHCCRRNTPVILLAKHMQQAAAYGKKVPAYASSPVPSRQLRHRHPLQSRTSNARAHLAAGRRLISCGAYNCLSLRRQASRQLPSRTRSGLPALDLSIPKLDDLHKVERASSEDGNLNTCAI